MPEGTVVYKGKLVTITLDRDGIVTDIDDGSGRYISENEKIAFEIDYSLWISDLVVDSEYELVEYRKARGRDRRE
jgi:hypothetical protein